MNSLPANNNDKELNSITNFSKGIIFPTKDPNLEKLRSEDGLITMNYKICFAKFKCRKFNEIPIQEATNKIYDLVIKAFKDLGHYNIDTNTKVLDHLPKAIISLIIIRKDFHYLTPELLSVILEFGCKGEFKKEGELNTISVIYVENWIIASKTHPAFKTATEIYIDTSKQLSEKKETINPVEEEKEICLSCLIAFEDFKRNKTLPLITRHLWKYIRNKTNFSWNESERKQILRIFESRKNELKVKRENLTNVGEEIKSFMPASVYSISMEIYFKRLISESKELILPYSLTNEFKAERWPKK